MVACAAEEATALPAPLPVPELLAAAGAWPTGGWRGDRSRAMSTAHRIRPPLPPACNNHEDR